MPLKVCIVHGGEFFARWRNTPAICEDCALHASMCPGCWRVTLHDDPAQLVLFDARTMARPGAWWSVAALVADHFSNRPPRNLELEDRAPWPRRATRAERTRYPFH